MSYYYTNSDYKIPQQRTTFSTQTKDTMLQNISQEIQQGTVNLDPSLQKFIYHGYQNFGEHIKDIITTDIATKIMNNENSVNLISDCIKHCFQKILEQSSCPSDINHDNSTHCSTANQSLISTKNPSLVRSQQQSKNPSYCVDRLLTQSDKLQCNYQNHQQLSLITEENTTTRQVSEEDLDKRTLQRIVPENESYVIKKDSDIEMVLDENEHLQQNFMLNSNQFNVKMEQNQAQDFNLLNQQNQNNLQIQNNQNIQNQQNQKQPQISDIISQLQQLTATTQNTTVQNQLTQEQIMNKSFFRSIESIQSENSNKYKEEKNQLKKDACRCYNQCLNNRCKCATKNRVCNQFCRCFSNNYFCYNNKKIKKPIVIEENKQSISTQEQQQFERLSDSIKNSCKIEEQVQQNPYQQQLNHYQQQQQFLKQDQNSRQSQIPNNDPQPKKKTFLGLFNC